MIGYIKLYDLIDFKIYWVLCVFSSVYGSLYLGLIKTGNFI